MIELGHLAQPVDSQSACGPDCEYEGDFLALSQAVVGKPEQQFGETVIAAVAPDWRAVERMATDLLGRTKDLRVVAWLTQAAIHLHGVSGFSAGVGLMHLLCEQYWDDVHPRMVVDGEADPYLRMNAFAALSDSTGGYSEGSGIMRALREAVLVKHASPITVRDVELGALKDSAARYSDAQIQAILLDAIRQDAEAVLAFEQGAQSVSSLCALIEEKVATDDQPDFLSLRSLTRAVGGAIVRARVAGGGGAISDGSADEISGSDEGGGSTARMMQSAPGEIRSREDVRRALERICEYLERYEPSNPAALFARRAERMLDKGFLDIMRELSPDNMHHLQTLMGVKPPDE